MFRTAIILTAAIIVSACEQALDEVSQSTPKGFCKDHNPLGNAYFGDLHVHTSLSQDAYQQDVRTMPKDAYDFAKGKEIPFHDMIIKIDRPLDFAAVTDHSEFLGDLTKCTNPNDPIRHTPACDVVLKGTGAAHLVLAEALEKEKAKFAHGHSHSAEGGHEHPDEHQGMRAVIVKRALDTLFKSEDPKINVELCGEDGSLCDEDKKLGWQKIVEAAKAAHDHSPDCQFTSFIGYEYSGVITGSNYHRNVIFRNENVPDAPVSYLDAPYDYMLWQKLEKNCLQDLPGCEFLTISHNGNLSNGKLYTPNYHGTESIEEQRKLALLRQRSEPLMEIFQHKGQSECINGLKGINGEDDPLCEFEQIRTIGGITRILEADLYTEECDDRLDNGGMVNVGCVSKNDYLRGALLTGLEEQERIGVNPLKIGVIASTDTHESTPGAVDEQMWQGHVGRENTLAKRLQKKTGLPYRLDGSAGGLAGVWASENRRDALFDAMKRRETFGTSGPRIKPRFFAGWSYEENMCEQASFISAAYQGGVPMGSDMTAPPDQDAKPRFVVAAERDAQGHLLQRLQVIKGWIDRDGEQHVRVIEVAGDMDQTATVDLETGKVSGKGFEKLCTVFIDEKFNPDEPAYYYLRVVENPSLRWSWAQCIALEKSERPEECENDAPKIIQERAWTSPIWYNADDYLGALSKLEK